MDVLPSSVTEFVFSDRNTDSELTIIHNGRRIHIAISAHDLASSPTIRDQYLHFLNVAEAYELDGLTVDDFYDWVLEGCAADLSRLPPLTFCANPTLEDYVHLETRNFDLCATEDNKFTLRCREANELEHLPFGVELYEEFGSSFPSFTLSQVEICADSPSEALSRTPRKVLVNRKRICFFKPFRYCDANVARHELRKYLEIKQAGLDDVRVPQLFGFVQEKGTNFGLLLTYIESKSVTLGCAIRPETTSTLRRRWAEQVTNTLSRLHGAGIIWGDAKPDNILIDIQDNAWIIDFGGGYTKGWVDHDLVETVRGDQQGLARIIEYIFQEALS